MPFMPLSHYPPPRKIPTRTPASVISECYRTAAINNNVTDKRFFTASIRWPREVDSKRIERQILDRSYIVYYDVL